MVIIQNQCFFKPITQSDMIKVVTGIDVKKSPGYDDIDPLVVK